MNITELNDILNGWPKHGIGYAIEKEVIKELNRLGAIVGYGRLAQIALHLRQIQCDNQPQEAIELKRNMFQFMGWELPQVIGG